MKLRTGDITKLKDEALNKVFAALAAAEGDLTEDEMQEVFSRLMSSKDQLKAELREEIEAEIREEYEVDVDQFPCEFYTESDHTVTLGMGEHERKVRIRYLNLEDATRLAAYIPDAVRYVYKRGPALLENLSVQSVINDVLTTGLRDTRNGKPTKFMIKLYEELAICLSNPEKDQILSASFLRACQPAQVIQAIRKLVEINQSFFTDLWHEVPGTIRTPVALSIGKITASIKNLGQKITESAGALASAGGTANGGTMSGSTSSLVSTGMASGKSSGSTSSKPTASGKAPTAAKKKADTSIGASAKASSPTKTKTTAAAKAKKS